MLKVHPIPAFMKTYTNLKNIFLVKVFWLKYNIRIIFKIPILDLMLSGYCQKTVFRLKGYTPVICVLYIIHLLTYVEVDLEAY